MHGVGGTLDTHFMPRRERAAALPARLCWLLEREAAVVFMATLGTRPRFFRGLESDIFLPGDLRPQMGGGGECVPAVDADASGWQPATG